MTLRSLQKIISLENELFAAEQAEQERISAWLKDQQAEILRQHEKQLAALEEKKKHAIGQAANKAKEKADALIRDAAERAGRLDMLEDALLRGHLEKNLRFITGRAP